MAEETRTQDTSDEAGADAAEGSVSTAESSSSTTPAGSDDETGAQQASTDQASDQQAPTEKVSTEAASGEKSSDQDDQSFSSQETAQHPTAEPARRSPGHARPQAPSEQDRDAQRAQQDTLVRGSEQQPEAPPRGRESRAPINVGELVWKVGTVLAAVIRIVGYVLAFVLVAYIVLTLVGVNPANGVARLISGIADVAVLSFRDLFLPANPNLALVVNDGLAAVFWLLAGEFLARLVRFVAARLS